MTSVAQPSVRTGGRTGGMVSGEAVTLELRPARLASRMIGTAIDFLVAYTVAIALIFVVAAISDAAHLDDALAEALLVAVVVASLIGYPVAMQVFCRGRTLGKMAMGLRVVRDDGGPVSFRLAVIRELVGFVVEKPGPLFGAPAVFCALIREDGKRVGDLAAGTIVISERVAQVGPQLAAPAMPPQLAAWATGLDLSRLPDDLALRAREVLGRAGSLRAQAREELGASIVTAVERAVGPAPAGTPGWAYLSAVLAERRRRDIDRLTSKQPVNVLALTDGPGWALAPPRPGGRELGTAAYDGEWSPPGPGVVGATVARP